MKKCNFCENLDALERECPDAPHHGAVLFCDECEAEYYEEYEGQLFATNIQAKFNHPELKKL